MHSYVLYIHSYKIYFESEFLTGIIKDTTHNAVPLQGAKCVSELVFASSNEGNVPMQQYVHVLTYQPTLHIVVH